MRLFVFRPVFGKLKPNMLQEQTFLVSLQQIFGFMNKYVVVEYVVVSPHFAHV